MELRALVAALGVWACCAGNLQAQSFEEFYSKQTVTIISAFNADGGNDIYCRLMARYLGRYIPGKTNVVVQNMPGAASMRETNYIWQVASRDGTVIANVQRTVPLHAALGKDFVFDVRKFTQIGSSSNFSDHAYVLFVRTDADVRTLDDLRTTSSSVFAPNKSCRYSKPFHHSVPVGLARLRCGYRRCTL